MHAISGFSLEQHPGEYANWPAKTRLYFQGKALNCWISGYVIEAQYQVTAFDRADSDACFLLLCSFDCPFEEANSFTLLSSEFQILATAELGAPYATFLLQRQQWLDDRHLALEYAEQDRYILELSLRTGWLKLAKATPRLRILKQK